MKNTATSREKLLDATFTHVYRYGYHGASTAAILREADVPKGSMYHHFVSKKGMVLAMIEERLAPIMAHYYDFTIPKGGTAVAILEYTFHAMSDNTMLMTYGCPLHRLMQETRAQDETIHTACTTIYTDLHDRLTHLLRSDPVHYPDPETLAETIILTTWGLLSRPLDDNPAEAFLKGAQRLLQNIRDQV